ncbi:MAG: hypothetical protein ACQETD_02165 [Pseudomonadota bacterium]
MMKRMGRLILLITLGLLLQACEINSSDEPEHESAAGIWDGTLSWDDGSPRADVMALSYAGRLIVVSPEQGILFDGGYWVDEEYIAASTDEYWLEGTAGDYQGIVEMSGAVETQHSLHLNLTTGDGAGGRLALGFVEQFNRDSSLAYLDGYWSYRGESASDDLTLNVDGDGELLGQDGYGCIFAGDLSRPERQDNIYRANVWVDNCGAYDGHYDGLATLLDGEQSDVLLIAFSNRDHAFFYDFGSSE